jgi:hypothetical protein
MRSGPADDRPERPLARQIENVDPDTLKAIANSAVAPDFADLNEVVKEWNP